METDFIIVDEYCHKSRIEPSFIISLEEGGLIEIQVIQGEKYLPVSQLQDLERYIHLHYDLSINIEGIDAIRHMLNRMTDLQSEITQLRNQLKIYRTGINFFIEE